MIGLGEAQLPQLSRQWKEPQKLVGELDKNCGPIQSGSPQLSLVSALLASFVDLKADNSTGSWAPLSNCPWHRRDITQFTSNKPLLVTIDLAGSSKLTSATASRN